MFHICFKCTHISFAVDNNSDNNNNNNNNNNNSNNNNNNNDIFILQSGSMCSITKEARKYTKSSNIITTISAKRLRVLRPISTHAKDTDFRVRDNLAPIS